MLNGKKLSLNVTNDTMYKKWRDKWASMEDAVRITNTPSSSRKQVGRKVDRPASYENWTRSISCTSEPKPSASKAVRR